MAATPPRPKASPVGSYGSFLGFFSPGTGGFRRSFWGFYLGHTDLHSQNHCLGDQLDLKAPDEAFSSGSVPPHVNIRFTALAGGIPIVDCPSWYLVFSWSPPVCPMRWSLCQREVI